MSKSQPTCKRCYPWPDVDAKEYAKLLQPFFYGNIKEAGIDICIGIRDTMTGTIAKKDVVNLTHSD